MKRQRFSVQFSFGLESRPPIAQPASESADSKCPGETRALNNARRLESKDETAKIRMPNPLSLLITDDDDAFRETLRSILEPEGFHTLLAE